MGRISSFYVESFNIFSRSDDNNLSRKLKIRINNGKLQYPDKLVTEKLARRIGQFEMPWQKNLLSTPLIG